LGSWKEENFHGLPHPADDSSLHITAKESAPINSSRLLFFIRRRRRRLPGFPALEPHAIAVPLQTLVARLLIVVEVRALG
jgi:hypothetical protein